MKFSKFYFEFGSDSFGETKQKDPSPPQSQGLLAH